MMNFKLRPNQQKGFNDLRDLIKNGKRRIIAVAPPGYGKTTLFSAIVASALANGNKIAIAIHKKELVYNAVDRLKSQFGIDAGIIMAGHPVDKSKKVQVGSIQTMTRRDLSWFEPDLYMVDEGHRLLTGQHLKMYSQWVCPETSKRAIPMIIWTATPVRTDRKRKFEDYCDALLQLSTYRQEMANKNLVPTRVLCPKGSASLDGIKLRMQFGEQDYDQEELSDRFMRIIKAVYAKWKQYSSNKQAIAFCVDKKHNRATCEYFQSQGVNAVYVDEDTPAAERDAIVAKFKKGPFVDNHVQVLFNIGLFSEGLDCEFARTIILNYATKSFTKYVQSSARGSRPCWNSDHTDWLMVDGKYYKEDVLILDFGGNTLTHGLLEDYDFSGFDLSGQKKQGEAPCKICLECREVIYASYKICPKCQFVFPVNKKLDTKKHLDEVELQELDKDQMIVASFIKMRAKKAEQVPTEQLRIVALIKRYDDRWLWARLQERGEYKQEGVFEWGNKPGSWKEYLENLEKEKGTYTIYERLKSKRLSI